ncbi:MAG: MFS transporter [Methanomassiliicoccales archaeon]|nr:MFS transporter [Methanomassiliicoccales archaeon]
MKGMEGRPGRYVALVIVMLGVFMSVLDAVALNIALPAITTYFQVAVADTQWVVTGYLLVQTCFLIICGKIAERVGQAKMFTIGLVVFSLASLLCALSADLTQLIAFRVVQGLGASMMFSVSTAIVFRLFTIKDRGKALGFLGSTVAVGGMLGPVIGGVLVGTFGWQSIFLVNVPIGLFAAVLAFKYLHLDETLSSRFKPDLVGALLWIVMMSALVLALGNIGNTGKVGTTTAGLLVVLVVMLILFIKRESRIEEPLLDLTIFKVRRFSLLVLSMVAFFISMNMVTILGPFYFEGVMVYDPVMVGLIFMILPAITMFGSPLVGRLYDRKRMFPYTTLAHLIRAAAFFTMAYGFMGANIPLVLVAFVLMGIGTCLFQTPNNAEMMMALPIKKSGQASSIQATTRNLSLAVGVSLATILMTLMMGSMDYGAIAGGPLAGELSDSVAIAVAFGGALSLLGAIISRFSEKGPIPSRNE